MSDLCMYEFEDNVWDEFAENDDHRVPHPSDGDGDKRAVQGDSHKKGRHEVVGMSASANAATKFFIHGNEENMTKKDTTVIDSRMAGHCPKGDNISSVGSEFCVNDPILDGSNNNSYDYPISHISQADNGLSFYDNDGGEDKESSDLLYYGWPDVGNFEDVDRMFRSCDSTFGMGSLNNDDDMCWFSPSHAAEGSEESLKSGFKFLCPESNQSGVLKNVSEHNAPSVQNNTSPSIDDADRKSLYLSGKVSNLTTDADDLDVSGCTQFLNELDAKSENSSQPVHQGQRKQSKHHDRQDRKRKDCYSENGGSIKQFGVVEHPFAASSKSNQALTPVDTRQHKQNIKPSPSISYTQTQAPYMHLDFSNPSDHMSVPSHPSPSAKESSHSSNVVQSTESSHGPIFKSAAIKNETKKKFHGRQDTQAPFSPNVVCNHVSVQKQTHQSENELDGQNEVEGAGVPLKLDSSDVQESTCVSSVLEEVSPQATSFRQLQQVMEQLDIRSKLCIRDSLYRLARSAEQRHMYLNPSGGSSNDRDVNGALVADETNKRAGFIDIETNTNPVDRSIAHLLFHRPRDPSAMPANDASSLKSHAKVQGSLPNPPTPEKQT